MMLEPGMRVFREVSAQETALGVVTDDGQHVLWLEVLDPQGLPGTVYRGLYVSRSPKPLTGRELPCPASWKRFVRA